MPGRARVLHLISTLGQGGAERQLSYLAPQLAERGWRVDVGSLRGGPNLARLQRAGVVAHAFHGRNNYDPRLLLQIMRLIRFVKPDLIQTWLTQMDVLGGLAARLARVKWVVSERSEGAAYPRSVKNLIRARLGRTAEAIVSNSRGGERYWERLEGSAQRFVVPNAVEVEHGTSDAPLAPGVIEFLADEPLALFIGRLTREKDPGTFVRALAMLPDDSRPRALLCGEGPLRREIEALVAQLRLEPSVRLLGNIADVQPLIGRAGVLVSPSEFEGEPNAVLEGMALGCPMVVSDIAAHRDLLDNTALYARVGSASEFAGAIMSSLAEREAARRRAEIARGRVGDRAPAVIAKSYDAIYRSLLAGSERGSQPA